MLFELKLWNLLQYGKKIVFVNLITLINNCGLYINNQDIQFITKQIIFYLVFTRI